MSDHQVPGFYAVGDEDTFLVSSRAAIVVVEAHVVRVAFDSGDILALSPRSALGAIDPPKPRAPRTRRTA